jgi:four helix bundle protein
MADHRDLDVWNLAMATVVDIYALTQGFPKEEQYGLTAQIRRAAVSIPSNIAEGAARNSVKEFVQFLYFALGSAAEAETQLMIGGRLGFSGDIEQALGKIQRIKMMLLGLIKAVKNKTERTEIVNR